MVFNFYMLSHAMGRYNNGAVEDESRGLSKREMKASSSAETTKFQVVGENTARLEAGDDDDDFFESFTAADRHFQDSVVHSMGENLPASVSNGNNPGSTSLVLRCPDQDF